MLLNHILLTSERIRPCVDTVLFTEKRLEPQNTNTLASKSNQSQVVLLFPFGRVEDGL